MSSDSGDLARYETASAGDFDMEDMRLEALGGRGARLDDSDDSGDYPGLLSAATGTAALKARVKELNRQLEQQRDETRLLREENDGLRRREVEIMALSTQLSHKFQSLQLQLDGLKSSVRTQLLNPLTDEEYHRLEVQAESERDLVTTIKLGIYQQLGSIRAARDTAVRRCAELVGELEAQSARNKQLNHDLTDAKVIRDSEQANFKRQMGSVEQRISEVAELRGKLHDLESKLRGAYVEQDQLLNAKLIASAKTNEVTRLQLLLKEAEDDSQRYKSQSDCLEQKLDILKSEFYDLRLKYNQRIAELEGQLKLAEERLKQVGDLELEAEAFMVNIATAIENGADMHGGGSSSSAQAAVSDACGRLMCVPNSRKVHHAVTVTRKCLQLDNQLTVVRSELKKSTERCERLEKSLELCRTALNNSNSPFAIAEAAVDGLTKENEVLQSQNTALRSENSILQVQVKDLISDVELLSRHRSELVRIREVLRQMGAPERLLEGNRLASPLSHQNSNSKTMGHNSSKGSSASSAKNLHQQHRNENTSRFGGEVSVEDDPSFNVANPQFVASNSFGMGMRREGDSGAPIASPEVIVIC